MHVPRPRSIMLHLGIGLAVIAGLRASQSHAQELDAVLVTNDIDSGTWVGSPPDEPDRLFALERSSGLVKVIRDGQVQPTPFLDVSANLRAKGDGGLLGMAFHPDFQSNGYTYFAYTDSNGDGIVERYTVSNADPDVADPSSALEIIKILRNPRDNLHAGGFIAFSPIDDYLYVGHGDAGPQGDPDGHSQDPQLLLGKIIRIDVDNPSKGRNYGIPADNPFVNDPNTLDEIWAIGFRNPWRASFDRETGDIYVGDVGFFRWEEVSFIPAGVGGGNYGWAVKEGAHCWDPPVNCDSLGDFIDPIHEYVHRISAPVRCAVSGGYVYRGSAIPLMRGSYFFGDYCSNEIWSFRYENGSVNEFQERTDELSPPGGGSNPHLVSFGEDSDGEMYIIDHNVGIYKIVTKMRLVTTEFVAGETASMGVGGARANSTVYFAYSTVGIGETPIPPLGVAAAILDPLLIRSARTNGSGTVSFDVTVPGNASGVEVWLQVAEPGNTSNVVNTIVQ